MSSESREWLKRNKHKKNSAGQRDGGGGGITTCTVETAISINQCLRKEDRVISLYGMIGKYKDLILWKSKHFSMMFISSYSPIKCSIPKDTFH